MSFLYFFCPPHRNYHEYTIIPMDISRALTACSIVVQNLKSSTSGNIRDRKKFWYSNRIESSASSADFERMWYEES